MSATVWVLAAGAVCCMGPIDRLRGDAWDLGNRTIEKAIYGILTTVVLLPALEFSALTGVGLVLVVLGLMAGMSVGWGGLMGSWLAGTRLAESRQAWWQVGPARDNKLVAAVLRGAIWGLPVIPGALVLGSAVPLLVIPAYMVAFPASLEIARRSQAIDKWAYSEVVRGTLAGCLLLTAVVLVEVI